MSTPFEILLVTAPGLEAPLADEARALGMTVTGTLPGGVTVTGGWPEVWSANYRLRGAARVLARIGSFRAFHLAQLDKRSRKFPWGDVLRPDVPVRIEVTTKASKIYHAKAAAQRVEKAITEELGAPISPEAEIAIKLRIDDNLCEFSVDTTGEALHKRGHKEAVGKAPMRENLAAMFLRARLEKWRSTAISLAWLGRPAIGPDSRASAGTSTNRSSIDLAPMVASIECRSVSVKGR